jgi:hypothetical protein
MNKRLLAVLVFSPCPLALGQDLSGAFSEPVSLLPSFSLFPAGAEAAPPGAPAPSRSRGVLTDTLRRAFRFAPAPVAAAGVPAEATGDRVMLLKPFRVVGTAESKVAQDIDAEREIIKAESFNPRDGGRFYSSTKGAFHVEVGLWTHEAYFPRQAGGMDFLRLRW